MAEADALGRILFFFGQNEGHYVSGEDISGALGISRASVWKYMSALRDNGYEIDAVPHLGYKLKSAPDKLFEYEIKNGLKSKVMGKGKIYHYETLPSTNDTAYSLAEEGAIEGTLVVAESQSRGKGRMGRTWVSPKDTGIYMSLVLRPDVGSDEIPAITLITAESIVNVMNKITGLSAGVKWPNDIVVADGSGGKTARKLAGILTEIKAQPDRVDFLVLGIGINVNTPFRKLPPGGTSLKNETGQDINRSGLIRDILKGFEEDYAIFSKKGFSSLRERCKKVSVIIGKEVKIKEHHHVIEGKAVDIDDKGALIVKDAKGKLRRVFSGDVVTYS